MGVELVVCDKIVEYAARIPAIAALFEKRGDCLVLKAPVEEALRVLLGLAASCDKALFALADACKRCCASGV